MPYCQLTSSDMRFYYTVSSPDGETLDPAKETVLFLHPGTTDSSYFAAQFKDPRFTNKYNLIAFDARAHGKTLATPMLDVTLERKARCLLEAWGKLNLPAMHIYGESFCGTTVGLYVSILRPELVKSLVLCSPLFGVESPETKAVYQKVQNLMLENKGQGDMGGNFSPDVLRVISTVWQGDHTNADQKAAYGKKFVERYGPGHTAEEVIELLNPLMTRQPMPDRLLEEVTCPVLLLHGTEDRAATFESVEMLQEKLCNAHISLHPIHGGPHFLSLCMPNIISRFILRFLDNVMILQENELKAKLAAKQKSHTRRFLGLPGSR